VIYIILAVVGYLWGGIPTADFIARRVGADLRQSGSRNPGTNNALRLAGPRVAAFVLVAELAKGSIAAALGTLVAGPLGGVVTGLGAVAGNIINPYFRGRGGKGLAISAGVILALWPVVLALVLPVLLASLAVIRKSGPATLLTLAVLVAAAFLWPGQTGLRPWLASGIALLVAPKAVRDARHPLRPSGHPESPE
jgi:glycerol-3-phosphate acyltransferase PlsY